MNLLFISLTTIAYEDMGISVSEITPFIDPIVGTIKSVMGIGIALMAILLAIMLIPKLLRMLM